MADSAVEALILELLEWVTKRDRTYEEVIEAWRTSCPQTPSLGRDRGLVVRENVNGRCVVRITSSGLDLLGQHDTGKQHE